MVELLSYLKDELQVGGSMSEQEARVLLEEADQVGGHFILFWPFILFLAVSYFFLAVSIFFWPFHTFF